MSPEVGGEELPSSARLCHTRHLLEQHGIVRLRFLSPKTRWGGHPWTTAPPADRGVGIYFINTIFFVCVNEPAFSR
jgi:hypothetical protein